MKIIRQKSSNYNPYQFFNKDNVLLQSEILNNIKKLHNNAINEQKSNILSLVAYKYLKPILLFKLLNIKPDKLWINLKTNSNKIILRLLKGLLY